MEIDSNYPINQKIQLQDGPFPYQVFNALKPVAKVTNRPKNLISVAYIWK